MCGDTCADSCAKCLLMIVNSLVWVAGTALLGVGIWVVVSPETFVANALMVVGLATQNDEYAMSLSEYLFANNQLLMMGAYFMIAAGAFLSLVGFCGCFGALKQSKCLLVIYCIFCGLAFCLVLAAGIIEIVYQNKMGALIIDSFSTLQVKQFDGLYNSTNPLSSTWYLIMQGSKCCGINGQGDFTVNASSMATFWYSNNRMTCASSWCYKNAMLPASCCMQNDDGTLVDPSCVTLGTQTYSYTTSCQSAAISQIVATFQQYSTIIMGVTFGLSGVCLLAIVAASIVIHDISRQASRP